MNALHIETPYLRSTPLSLAAGADIWLKLESAQPVGSFKIRGIGRACQESVAAGASRLVSSSGGNAGYAVAYAGRRLEVAVEVFVPQTTPQWMRDVIRAEGAVVIEHGSSWDDAHAHAVGVANAPPTAYIHPFDDPRIWAGHATLIHEMANHDTAKHGTATSGEMVGEKPDAVVVSVGGGGLMIGVLEGMHACGWGDVPLVAVETVGASSFAQSIEAGKLVTLDRIDSVASSLGARTVSAETLVWAARHEIRNCVVSDRAAVRACVRFAADHRVLVEPACGASLSAVYDRSAELDGAKTVAVVVCGGAAVDLTLLEQWRERTS